MAHKFHIGQIVELEPSLLRSIVPGPHEIRKLIPAPDRDPDDPCYCVKSAQEKHERAVLESQIMRPAVRHLRPTTGRNEDSLLLAFDANRRAIYAAAIKAFKQGRKGSYELGMASF